MNLAVLICFAVAAAVYGSFILAAPGTMPVLSWIWCDMAEVCPLTRQQFGWAFLPVLMMLPVAIVASFYASKARQ